MIDAIKDVFANPFFGALMAFLGLFASYYFYVKQKRDQTRMENIISRLQEENTKLREALNPEEELTSDPSREQRLISLRASLLAEDRRPSRWVTSVPAFAIITVIWIFGLAAALVTEYYVIFILGLVPGLLVYIFAAMLLDDWFDYIQRKKISQRLYRSFMAARLNLREIDRLITWTNSRQWSYLSRNWLLRSFDFWGKETAKEWARESGSIKNTSN